MSHLQEFKKSNQYGNSGVSDSKADIPSNSFKPRSRDKQRMPRAPSNNQFKSFDEENNSQQMKIQRTRYNPNLHPQDRLSRSSEDFEFEQQSRTGNIQIPGAPLPPTQANFAELSPDEKAQYMNKYSNYYMEQKRKYNDFVRQVTQDVQIEQYPIEKLGSVVTSKSKTNKSSSIEGFFSKNIVKRRNDSIEEVTKLKSHFLQSNVDQLSSVYDYGDRDEKRGNKQEFDYSRDQSLAYNLGLKINKKGQFVNETDQNNKNLYTNNGIASNFEINTPQKMAVRTEKNSEVAQVEKNMKSPISIQNLFGGNVKFNQGPLINSDQTGAFGQVESPNSKAVSGFGFTTAKKDGDQNKIKQAIKEEHESFIIKEQITTPKKKSIVSKNNGSINLLQENFQQNIGLKVVQTKKAFVAKDAQKEMVRQFNSPHDSSRKVRKVVKMYSKKIDSFERKQEMFTQNIDSKVGQENAKSGTQSKSNHSLFITPVPPSQIVINQKVQIKPCNLNSSKRGEHAKVMTLADRVESSFGDEDDMVEDDLSPSPQIEEQNIDDLDATDLMASPKNLETQEKIIEKELPIPEQDKKPKFSEKEIEEAKLRIIAPFGQKFIKKVSKSPISPTLESEFDEDKTNQAAPTPTIDFSLDSLRMNHVHFQYPTRKRERLNIEETQMFLQTREIPCLKYNYTLDKYLNMDHFFATIRLSQDSKQFVVYNIKPDGYKEVQQDEVNNEMDIETTRDPNNTNDQTKQENNKSIDIMDQDSNINNFDQNTPDEQKDIKAIRTLLGANNKQWDERMSMVRKLSKGSFKVADIKSFTYGGFSSRFWVLRKHINSLDALYLKDLPFYCWECITIHTASRELNLVIKDQEEMQALLEFLIINLQTKDGFRGTALPQLDAMISRNYPNLDDSNLQFDHVFNEQRILAEQELYLKVFKAFNLMKARMKISFMALQKSQTIKEFLLEGILESYNYLVQIGIIDKTPTQNTHNQLFFQKILAGRANIKQFAWRIRNKEQNDSSEVNEDQYNVMYNQFLMDEVKSLIKKCKSQMIFNTLQLGQLDEFEHLQKHMDSQIEFGFQQTRTQIIMRRLELICRLGLVSGPQFIQVLLQKIKFVKQLFVIQLENGKEVNIPIGLSQKVLPSSFRYYDPIIKISQQRISQKKRKKLQMQQALIGKLSNQYSLLGMLGFNKKQRNTMIQKSEANQLPDVGIDINYKESLHTNQIQRSNYIKLDDNVLNFNFDPSGHDQMIGEEMQNTLHKDISRVQLKYINQDLVQQKRASILEYKRQLSAQIENLKYKGMRIEKLDILDKQLDPSGIGNFLSQDKIQERNEILRKKDKELMDLYKQKKDVKAIQRNQDKKLMTADQFEKRVDGEIEINLKYFAPEFKIQQEDFDDLMENIINNEKKMKEKRVLKQKGKQIREQINKDLFKNAILNTDKISKLRSSINLHAKSIQSSQAGNSNQEGVEKKNDINKQIMELFGQNIRVDMIHFERARILKDLHNSRKKRRNMSPEKTKQIKKLLGNVQTDFQQRIQDQIKKNQEREKNINLLTHSDDDHCSSDGEYENQLLSPKQVSHAVAIKSAFDAIDVGGDGFVSKDELGMLLKRLRNNFDDKKAEEIFQRIDTDGSGLISFDEFLMACNQRLI